MRQPMEHRLNNRSYLLMPTLRALMQSTQPSMKNRGKWRTGNELGMDSHVKEAALVVLQPPPLVFIPSVAYREIA